MRRAFAAILMRSRNNLCSLGRIKWLHRLDRLRRLCEPDRVPRDFGFGEGTGFRNLLNRMTIAIAAGEIHLSVGAARIFAQRLLDDTHRFDELAPIHPFQKTQA